MHENYLQFLVARHQMKKPRLVKWQSDTIHHMILLNTTSVKNTVR
jgi:hypothetical protein